MPCFACSSAHHSSAAEAKLSAQRGLSPTVLVVVLVMVLVVVLVVVKGLPGLGGEVREGPCTGEKSLSPDLTRDAEKLQCFYTFT